MKASILQFKPKFGDVSANFETVTKLMESFEINSTDIILLPELWSTGFIQIHWRILQIITVVKLASSCLYLRINITPI